MACEKKFQKGDALVTLLQENLAREDFCPDCEPKKETMASWKSIIPAKKPRSLKGLDEFFAKLKQALEAGKVEHAYPLALFLQRRGFLHKIKTLKRKNGDVALFEVQESGEGLQVPIVHPELETEEILGPAE